MSDTSNDPFREFFFEEADELLTSLRLDLDEWAEAVAERGKLDRIYRSVHSLKGAAGMVGLSTISEFARLMERVLGHVRTGKSEGDTREIGDVMRSSRDHLESMVAAARKGEPEPSGASLMVRLAELGGPSAQ